MMLHGIPQGSTFAAFGSGICELCLTVLTSVSHPVYHCCGSSKHQSISLRDLATDCYLTTTTEHSNFSYIVQNECYNLYASLSHLRSKLQRCLEGYISDVTLV